MDEDLIRQVTKSQEAIDSIVKPEVAREWISWTPSIVQFVAVTSTVNYARYKLVGDLAVVQISITCTSAGIAANPISIQGQPTAIWPVNIEINSSVIGTGIILDLPTTFYQGSLISVGPTDWRIIAHNQTGAIGVTPNIALANGDLIGIQATYEI